MSDEFAERGVAISHGAMNEATSQMGYRAPEGARVATGKFQDGYRPPAGAKPATPTTGSGVARPATPAPAK